MTMTSYRLSRIFRCFLYFWLSFSSAVLNRFLLLRCLTAWMLVVAVSWLEVSTKFHEILQYSEKALVIDRLLYGA